MLNLVGKMNPWFWGGAALASVAGCASPAQKQPNVICILADDLGYTDVSCYRNYYGVDPAEGSEAQTPNLDRLAAQGMMFTDFYSGAPVSSAARAALMTGRNCTRVGVYNWIPPASPMHMRDEETTIAEVMKAGGYRTAHFGKWHLTSEGMGQPIPNDQGFDYSFFAYNNALPSHKNPVNYLRNGEPVGELEGFACQIVVDEAIEWLDENASQPFYINVWFNEPHSKEEAPDSLKARHKRFPEYYGCIENMDLAIGRLMAYLEEKGLADHTIVTFASDNGSQKKGSNLPLRGAKLYNFEGGACVPFIIRYPGVVPAGVISSATGSFLDLLPTFASMAGVPLPEGLSVDGTDISDVFSGKADRVEKRGDALFFYRYFNDPICMLREGKWCLVGYQWPVPEKGLPSTKIITPWNFEKNHMDSLLVQKPRFFELYDLEKDKFQKENLAEKHPETVEKMKAKMLRLREETVREGGNWFD